MEPVEFYFDFSCPWSYLAFARLREASIRMGAQILWCPVRADEILPRAQPDRPAGREPAGPRKSAYEALDIEAWADYVGIRINRPDGWPADSTRAAVGLLSVLRQDPRLAADYCDAVFAGYFGLGRDIGAGQTVIELAGTAGLDRDTIAGAVVETALIEVLAGHEQRLLERGGFGTPTLFVGPHMFFGSDRMPLVEFALGQSSDRTFVMPGEHG